MCSVTIEVVSKFRCWHYKTEFWKYCNEYIKTIACVHLPVHLYLCHHLNTLRWTFGTHSTLWSERSTSIMTTLTFNEQLNKERYGWPCVEIDAWHIYVKPVYCLAVDLKRQLSLNSPTSSNYLKHGALVVLFGI